MVKHIQIQPFVIESFYCPKREVGKTKITTGRSEWLRILHPLPTTASLAEQNTADHKARLSVTDENITYMCSHNAYHSLLGHS